MPRNLSGSPALPRLAPVTVSQPMRLFAASAATPSRQTYQRVEPEAAAVRDRAQTRRQPGATKAGHNPAVPLGAEYGDGVDVRRFHGRRFVMASAYSPPQLGQCGGSGEDTGLFLGGAEYRALWGPAAIVVP